MAIARLHMRVGKTRNASSHACYIAREGKYRNRLEQGEKLEHTEYGNMPSWAKEDPNLFWQSSDYYERRNGTNYREMEIALPRELTAEQRKVLVNEFVQQEIGKKHAYQYAIHNPKSLDGGEQPHVHLMFSERLNDGIERDPEQYFKRYNPKHPEKGGARKQYGEVNPNLKLGKERTEARANELKDLRERWEQTCNKHLVNHGYQHNVISMKSYQAQGITLVPEQKQLPSQWRNKQTKAGLLHFRQAKAAYKHATETLNQTIPDLPAEIANQRSSTPLPKVPEKEPIKSSIKLSNMQSMQEQLATLKTQKTTPTPWKTVAEQLQELKQQNAIEKTDTLKQPNAHNEQHISHSLSPKTHGQQRLQQMTAIELKREIERSVPENPKDIAERKIDVLEARKIQYALSKELEQTKKAMEKLSKDYGQWRAEHPKRASLHKSGWMGSKHLSNMEAQYSELKDKKQDLEPQLAEAKTQADCLAEIHRIQITEEQKPQRKLVDSLEKLYQQKLTQEREQQDQERERRFREYQQEKVIQEFKDLAGNREHEIYGYGDNGRYWKRLSKETQTMIDTYNQRSDLQKQTYLEHIRQQLTEQPETLKAFEQQLSPKQRSRMGFSL